MEQRLEAVVVPVSDVDRVRHFYRALGFRLDLDRAGSDGQRVVRLTPPGSSCSIVLSRGSGSTTGILIVADLDAAVAVLRALGAGLSPISHRTDGYAHASFRDPDGNLWLLLRDIPAS